MDMLGKIKRLFNHPYIAGAEERAPGKAILTVDPDIMDKSLFGNLPDSPQLITVKQMESIAAEVAKQLDERIPGISEYFRKEQLASIGLSALQNRDAALEATSDMGVVVMTHPSAKHRDDVLRDMNLVESEGHTFKREHFKPLPGNEDDYNRWAGGHEAEHAFQSHIDYSDIDEIENIRQTLEGEILSDMGALNDLRKNGKADVAQAIIDIRVLNHANVGKDGADHAVSIFLNKPAFEGVTREQVEAAREFPKIMIQSVAGELGISNLESARLRVEDPQRFAKIVEEGLKKGSIPGLRDLTGEEMKKRIAEDMGISVEDFQKLGPDRMGDVAGSYRKLKEQGDFRIPRTTNPHTSEYMTQYVGAVQRMMIPDTTPAPVPAPAAAQDYPEVTPDDATPEPPDPTPSPDETLKTEAKNQASDLLAAAILADMEERNISSSEMTDILNKNPNAFMDLTERLLKENKVSFVTKHTAIGDEADEIAAQKVGMPKDEFQKLSMTDPFLHQIMWGAVEDAGGFEVKRYNPHVGEIIQGNLRAAREETAKVSKKAEPEAAAEEKASEGKPPLIADINLTSSFEAAHKGNTPGPAMQQNASAPARPPNQPAQNDWGYHQYGTGGP